MLIFFGVTNSYSQDTIIKLNQTPIYCKVIEVGSVFISFEINKNGVWHLKKIDRADVSRIKYANGYIDRIAGKRIDYKSRPKSFKENNELQDDKINTSQIPASFSMYFTLSDIYFNLLSGGFIYTLPSGYVSLEVPFSTGFVTLGIIDTIVSPPYGYYDPNKIYSIGINLNYHPKPKQKIQPILGMSLNTGKYNCYKTVHYYQNQVHYTRLEKATDNYTSVFTKVGVMVTHSKHFQYSIHGGLGFTDIGVNESEIYDTYGSSIEPGFQLSFNVGYKF